MKKLFLYCSLFIASLTAYIQTTSDRALNDSVEQIQLSDEQADILHDIDHLLHKCFYFIALHARDVAALEQLKTAFPEHGLTYGEAFNLALSDLEPFVSDNKEAAELYNALEAIQKRAVFAGVTIFDRFTIYGQSLFYGRVIINGLHLPTNQPALSVNGTALFGALAINSLNNVYGNSPTGPTQFVIINQNGVLGSTPTAGSGGTVTSVSGSSNITVINPTTTPVVSLNPTISVTSVNATGAISANAISANNITINGPLTIPNLTVSGASGNVDDLFTVGTGGALSPAALVAGSGIIITPSAGTIGIASSPLTIQCDTGSATENANTLTFTATSSGNTVAFNGSASTVSLDITDSIGNIALGAQAVASGSSPNPIGSQGGPSVAIGYNANASSPASVAIGYNASATDYGIAIGANETAAAQTMSIGTQSALTACYIGGIYGVAGTGNTVLVTSSNQLVAPSSSRRYKENITPLPDVTNELMQLNPTSFSYIKDETHTKHLGFIAEEVEPLFPEIIVRDNDGVVESLCLPFFTPVVVKTMQEQQNIINTLSHDCEHLETEIVDLKKIITMLLLRQGFLLRLNYGGQVVINNKE